MVPIPVRGSALRRVRHLVPVTIALVLLAVVVTAIASTYVGGSRSPYDTCYGTNGRAVSCAVLKALR